MANETSAERQKPEPTWKVGALARRTGVTVRALHHYDQLGLLTPSQRTSGGHRVYTADSVARLYRITMLRGLGFDLQQIARMLDEPGWDLAETVRRHLTDLHERIDLAVRLRSQLRGILAELDRSEPDQVDLFSALEAMSMLNNPARSSTAILVYEDLAAALDYHERVLGLAPGPVHREESGRIVHAEVLAGSQVIWLHPSGEGYVSPKQVGATTGMTVVEVDDVDAHHQHTSAAGAEIVEEPLDQDYGVREYGVRDLEGHLWFFHAPLADREPSAAEGPDASQDG